MANLFRLDRTPRTLKRAGVRLCGAAWILFVVSMFLPAAASLALSGWQCAWLTLTLPYYFDEVGAVFKGYYFSFVAANLLMLTAPLCLRRTTKKGGSSLLLSALLILAFADAVSLLLPCNGPLSEWQIGYYVWMASFGLMATGSLLLAEARRMKSAPVAATVAPLPRTPEETAAERELRD